MPEKEGIEKLIRPDLVSFGGYSARKAPETFEGKVEVPVESIIKLDANENLYGCSPDVGRALAAYTEFNIYPDDRQTVLRKLLEGYTGADAECIVAGSGSNTLIDLVLRLFLAPGDEVINCVPTFGIYRFSTDLCGGRLVEVPRDNDFAVDVTAVKKAVTSRTKMIFLTNPNNPTGTLTPERDIIEILDTGVPVMIDEAYYEFSRQTSIPLLARYGNLMILRTFSKLGLAGLRLGLLAGDRRWLNEFNKVRLPYNINSLTQASARFVLQQDEFLQQQTANIVHERGRLADALKSLAGLHVWPSNANFILFRTGRQDAGDIFEGLKRAGILIKKLDGSHPLLRNCLRVTVGLPEENDAFLKALASLL